MLRFFKTGQLALKSGHMALVSGGIPPVSLMKTERALNLLTSQTMDVNDVAYVTGCVKPVASGKSCTVAKKNG